MGSHLGKSVVCTFTEQVDRKLVCIIAQESAAPTAVFASAPSVSKLDLLRGPLSAAAHTTGEHVRKIESTGSFSCSEMKKL